MKGICRVGPRAVALETTLLLHGVPREHALSLSDELSELVRSRGAEPALVGVFHGVPTVGLLRDELEEMIDAGEVAKVNTSNLGFALHRKIHGATTVATTMELAARAGVRVFATGGIGGVHMGYGERLDISGDLAAMTRFPVAVVTSGAKSILDVMATRELLESLGIPVVGHQTDDFPAFYQRKSGATVDMRMDHLGDLAGYIDQELARTGRGIVVANPIPRDAELDPMDWARWLEEARKDSEAIHGRDATPALLSRLHRLSGGETLRANLELVRSNVRLASELVAALP